MLIVGQSFIDRSISTYVYTISRRAHALRWKLAVLHLSIFIVWIYLILYLVVMFMGHDWPQTRLKKDFLASKLENKMVLEQMGRGLGAGGKGQ